MSTSTIIVSHQAPGDQSIEQSIRETAASEGLRLERSRRLHDTACGPTLYWLFDVSSRILISSKSGWTLDEVSLYLTS